MQTVMNLLFSLKLSRGTFLLPYIENCCYIFFFNSCTCMSLSLFSSSLLMVTVVVSKQCHSEVLGWPKSSFGF